MKWTSVIRALAAFGAALLVRIGPFLDLLDARYLPLLFVGAPQAYTVYAWLRASGAPENIAILGGVGFEFVYVGSIAWAARGAGWSAARGPAITALAFGVAVAVAHYAPQEGAIAILHAGFPLVGYFYVLMIHAPHQNAQDARTKRTSPAHRFARPRIAGRRTAPLVAVQVNGAQPSMLSAPTMRALPAEPSASKVYACVKCGAAVESAAHRSASGRFGCVACKVPV